MRLGLANPYFIYGCIKEEILDLWWGAEERIKLQEARLEKYFHYPAFLKGSQMK